VSVLLGAAFIIGAAGTTPALSMLALYAATGGIDFIIEASLLARRHHRVATVAAPARTARVRP
jgi:hypothetical protein